MKPDCVSKKDWELLKRKYKNIDQIINKINNGYPIQYLIGDVSFYGYIIKVNPSVLIPRFETEGLVEKTLRYIKDLDLNEASVLDIGTGSGCISIALKKEKSTLEITAIDNSYKALITAKRNAKLNKVNINFIHKNIFKFNIINKYDVIISNPPYISNGDKVSESIKFEPQNAIYVDGDPLKYYKKILDVSKNCLNSKFLIAFEIDELQGKNLKKLAKSYYSKSKIIIEKDLANKDRYLFIINE